MYDKKTHIHTITKTKSVDIGSVVSVKICRFVVGCRLYLHLNVRTPNDDLHGFFHSFVFGGSLLLVTIHFSIPMLPVTINARPYNINNNNDTNTFNVNILTIHEPLSFSFYVMYVCMYGVSHTHTHNFDCDCCFC